MYDNSKAFVATEDGDTDTFDINVGVLQGDTLAPFLFIIVVDYVLRQVLDSSQKLGFQLQSKRGSRQPAKFLSDLDFADDIALMSSLWENAQTLLGCGVGLTTWPTRDLVKVGEDQRACGGGAGPFVKFLHVL